MTPKEKEKLYRMANKAARYYVASNDLNEMGEDYARTCKVSYRDGYEDGYKKALLDLKKKKSL